MTPISLLRPGRWYWGEDMFEVEPGVDLYSRVPLLYLAEATINDSSLKGSTAHLILRVAYDASTTKPHVLGLHFQWEELFWNVLGTVRGRP